MLRLPACLVRRSGAALLVALVAPAAFASSFAEHRVGQKNKAFSESALTVKTGDRIVFHNDDTVPHNVYSPTPGFAFNVRSQAPGTDGFVSFDKPGTVDVRCAFHPGMKMAVTVQP